MLARLMAALSAPRNSGMTQGKKRIKTDGKRAVRGQDTTYNPSGIAMGRRWRVARADVQNHERLEIAIMENRRKRRRISLAGTKAADTRRRVRGKMGVTQEVQEMRRDERSVRRIHARIEVEMRREVHEADDDDDVFIFVTV